VGTAVAAGYLLGRFKKLRLALVVGSALAHEDVRQAGADLLTRGPTGMVTSTAGRTIAGQLVKAGRSAAVGAAGSRIGGLSDRLSQRTATLRGQEPDEDEEELEDEPEEELDDEYDDDEPDEEPENEDFDAEPDDEYDEDDDQSDEIPPQRSPRRQRTATPGGRR
jgi:hypothetical protein